MLELWRVLKLHGVLIMITTMPPEVFEAIAMVSLLNDTEAAHVRERQQKHPMHQQQWTNSMLKSTTPGVVVSAAKHNAATTNMFRSISNWNVEQLKDGKGFKSEVLSSNVIHVLNTEEGGVVYYYAITKLGDAVGNNIKTSDGPVRGATGSGINGRNIGSDGSNTKGDQKEGIMAGIQALLDEARKAKEMMESAASKVYIIDVLSIFIS
jgi:hypothetical protein